MLFQKKKKKAIPRKECYSVDKIDGQSCDVSYACILQNQSPSPLIYQLSILLFTYIY
jgi:hypothetical protein